jgi:uncharacterized protein DUF4189
MRGLLLVALPLLALLPGTTLGQQEYFGAIAYSLRTGAHGWASNHPSRSAAEKVALANCRKYATDCKTQVWFKNACAALATGEGGGFGTAWGNSQKAVDDEALKLCAKHAKGCSVVRRVCSDGKS